ncbi:SH3 domain-containing protein [Desulfuribacillus alkaliarsenatis]|uniref:SH3b domain-containing protein n=1 Tax=Desulfuribacillus alkaliarsenatis TaxID=766136 RepID=A0A1E5G0S2_9FIRM|nr:SH3 domain-containing protein [Desulfuribacillus alkaliarsenatis]OEF96329.1 hypothetical protein BHF68_09235 [Desulfuribacillus alkaliarsenatis]
MKLYIRSFFIMTIFILLFTFTYLEAANKKQANIDVNTINVRSGPGTEHNIIGTLPKNSIHTIIEEKDRWYKIPLNNQEGWIASWLVSVKEPVLQQETTSIQVVESTVATLNVRTGPSLSFPVLGTIRPTEFYPLVEKQGEWLKIQLNSQHSGWVSTNFVRIANKNTEVVASNKYVTITASILNVRAEPTTSATILAKLSRGEQVTLIDVKDGWYKITFDNTTGWIASDYAQEIATNNNTDANTPNNINDNNMADNNGNNIDDNASNGTDPSSNNGDGASDSIDGNQEEVKEVKHATVDVNILNVRAGPNTSEQIMGKLSMRETVEIIEQQGEWLKISFNGSEGWIASQFVTITTKNQSISHVPQVIIPKTGINIRSGPGTNYSIIKSANEGDTFNIISTHGTWYEIILSNSQKGFVASWVVQAVGIEGSANDRSIAGLLAGKTIVVDPGHGGIDAGAIGSHFRSLEKDLTLSTALLLESKLKAAGANVVMTRNTDRFLSLSQRVAISSNHRADAFISIHYNTNHNPLVNGTIVYHYSRNGNDADFARVVQQEIVKHNGLQNLGARQGNYYVLRENPQLSILVEAAFLSNYNDELLSRTRQFQDQVAEGIFQGVIRYFN